MVLLLYGFFGMSKNMVLINLLVRNKTNINFLNLNNLYKKILELDK